MKVVVVESKFKPVIITLETQEEVDELYSVLNYAPALDGLGHNGTVGQLWDRLNACHSRDYVKFFEKMEASINAFHKRKWCWQS